MTTTVEHPATAAEVLRQLEQRGLSGDESSAAMTKSAGRGGTVQAADRSQPQVVTLMGMDDGRGGENVADLFGAVAKAQGEFGAIERTLTAKIKSKREGGADYTYDYAPLDAVLAAVRPALSKYGVALLQFPLTRGGSVLVRTLFGHESGQRIWNDLTVGCTSTDAKDIGSAITYARRYGLMALAGIAPDHDDDGMQARGERGEIGPRESARMPVDARERVTSCRVLRRGDKPVYAVRTAKGECFTEDKALYDAAEAAMKAERPVLLLTEARTTADGKKFQQLVEIA